MFIICIAKKGVKPFYFVIGETYPQIFQSVSGKSSFMDSLQGAFEDFKSFLLVCEVAMLRPSSSNIFSETALTFIFRNRMRKDSRI